MGPRDRPLRTPPTPARAWRVAAPRTPFHGRWAWECNFQSALTACHAHTYAANIKHTHMETTNTLLRTKHYIHVFMHPLLLLLLLLRRRRRRRRRLLLPRFIVFVVATPKGGRATKLFRNSWAFRPRVCSHGWTIGAGASDSFLFLFFFILSRLSRLHFFPSRSCYSRSFLLLFFFFLKLDQSGVFSRRYCNCCQSSNSFL